jgi:ABC-type transporter Mla subunit MlaD
MEQAVREDAQRLLPRLASGAFPVAWPRRRGWGALLALLALGLALASPEWDLFGRRSGEKTRTQALLQVQNAGTALEQRVKKYEEEARARGVEPGQIGKNLEQLAAELKEGIQDPKAALAEVNDLQARLKAEMDQFQEKDKAALAKDLQRALRAQAAEQGKAPPGAQADALKDLIDDVRELSKKAEAGTASPQELAEMQKALSSLAEALGKTGATRQLAEELSRAAEALDQNPGALPQLSDDLKKLSDQLGQMDQALDKEQMMEMAKADLEELRRQLGGQAQDPWTAEVTPEDQQAFDQLAQADPQKQPGGT